MSVSYRKDSVLGGALDQDVLKQINIRRNILLKRSARTDQEILYLNSTTGWVKVTSSVNVNTDPTNRFQSTNGFAKRNVLLGGLLAADAKQMRRGILNDSRNAYDLTEMMGYRPMPGITSFTVDSKNTFGTLRVATINVKVNNVEQLSEIDKLFFRPGMSALVEWGHSTYFSNTNLYDSTIETFPNFFEWGKKQQDIYDQIEEIKKASSYNYDGMYGFIKNFYWSYNIDGGYDCRIDIVSKGDMVESISALVSPVATADTKLNEVEQDNQEQFITNLHVVLNTIKNAPQGTTPNKIVDDIRKLAPDIGQKMLDNLFRAKRKLSDSILAIILEGIPEEGEEIFKETARYIKMSSFLELLNRSFMLKDGSNGDAIVDFNYGQSSYATPYLSFPGHFALDPQIALIPKKSLDTSFRYRPQSRVNTNSDEEERDILNIYLNIDFLLNTFDQIILSQDDATEQNILRYVNSILGALTDTFGNVNDFSLHFDEVESRYFVVDRKIVPASNDLSDSKIDLVGLGSQIENLSITSTLSSNISSMMAIAAQASSTDVGADMLAMQQWNKGLIDRHLAVKQVSSKKNNTPTTEQAIAQKKAEEMKADIDRLTKFLSTVNSTGNDYYLKYSFAEAQGLSASHRYMMVALAEEHTKTSLQNPGGLIPFTLSFTMKGISGLKIGQGFRMLDESILPDHYKNKVAFLITGLSNSLENGRWVTKVDAKMIYSLEYTKEEADAVVSILPKPDGTTDSDTAPPPAPEIDPKTNKPIDPETGSPIETPNADRLRAVIKQLGYTEKGQELSNGGDITPAAANMAIAVIKTIKQEAPDIGVKFSAGNDSFHQNLKDMSRHKAGNAVDIVISPATPQNIAKVKSILQGYAAGNKPNFRFLDEYEKGSKNATGRHFHFAWGNGTEGQAGLNQSIALANQGKIKTYKV